MFLIVYVLAASYGVLASPVEHNPWQNGLCGSYFILSQATEGCRGDIFDLPLLDGEGSVTANMLRTAVARVCSPQKLAPYVACVRNVTAQCTHEERALIMAEVTQYYARCDGQNQVSDWIYDYALNGFDHVEPACLNIYRELCVDALPQFRTPDQSTSLREVLRMAKHNSHIMVECSRRHVQSVIPTLPGCTATWQDAYFALLLELSKDARLGIRLYQEDIQTFQINSDETGVYPDQKYTSGARFINGLTAQEVGIRNSSSI